MRKLGKKVVFILLGLILVLTPMIGACTGEAPPPEPPPGPAPGPEKPAKLIVPNNSAYTGPYSATPTIWGAGVEDYFNHINETEGGVDGVPLELLAHDNTGDPAVVVRLYEEVRGMDPIPPLMVTCQSVTTVSLRDRFQEDNVFCIAGASGLWPPGWVASNMNSFGDTQGLNLQWIAEQWNNSGESRKCRIALLNVDFPGSIDLHGPEMEQLVDALGMELVHNSVYPLGAVDITADILKMMQQEPDWVLGLYLATFGGPVYQGLQSLGYRDDVKIAVTYGCLDPFFARQWGEENLEGVIGATGDYIWFPESQGPKTSGDRLMVEIWDKSNRPADWKGTTYNSGVTSGMFAVAMLEKAVAAVGWDNLDGQAVHDAVMSTQEIDLGPGVTRGGLAPGARSNSWARMWEYQADGSLLPISDFLQCPDMRLQDFRTQEYNWQASGWPEGYFNE